jgi:hypothetical protein
MPDPAEPPTARTRALPRYRQLDDALIEQTIARLRDRIGERFPESGLRRVSAELLSLAREASERAAYARRPHWPTRIGVGVAIAAMAAVVVAGVATALRLPAGFAGLSDVVQATDAVLSDLVFLGATVAFLVTLESRIKRQRVLVWLYQLRSVAHIVDMHQLTKDPERLMSPQRDTASSPVRTMTAPELGRYLDYCSEMLSLTSKVAALVVQRFTDPVVLAAVNEIEVLCTGLSGKVWQKITLLERVTARAESPGGGPGGVAGNVR